VNYWSVWRDWSAPVPWGWNIRTEQDKNAFASTNLTGPFAPEFYLGLPSFGVRWYANDSGHTLPDGLVEYYKDGDDFIEQMLSQVYPGHQLVSKFQADRQGKLQPLADPVPGEIDEVAVGPSRRKGRRFIVLHEIPAPRGARYGVLTDPKTGARGIARLHEYVVIQLDTGFYVLVYPATLRGYDVFSKQFHNFVAQFHIAKEGPEGKAPASPLPADGVKS